MQHRQTLIATVFALLLPGCFLWSSGESAPGPIQISILGSSRLNPDEQGQSLPTVVKIYQLKAAARVEGADFEGLYRHEKETLGEDLIRVDDLVIGPGQQETKTLERDKAARALVAVAIFRRPAGTSWRSIVELPPSGKTSELSFTLEDYRIERK
jgi:type VI secretion system protein VasD